MANAFIRIVNEAKRSEIVRYGPLRRDYSTEDGDDLGGSPYRPHAGEWKFKAVGQGYAGGLRAVVQPKFGINI